MLRLTLTLSRFSAKAEQTVVGALAASPQVNKRPLPSPTPVTPTQLIESTPTLPSASNSASTEKQHRSASGLIESALAGDVGASVDAVRKIGKCGRRRDSLEATERQSAILSEKAREELILDAAKKVDACDQFMDVSVAELRTRIKNEADQGDPIARFMFSMWAPTDRTSTILGSDIHEFEKTALEYTQKNRWDKPELALLALGLSYSYGEHFTPQRRSLGSAYLRAAVECGIEYSPAVTNALKSNERMTSMPFSRGIADPLDIDTTAASLYTEFCGG